MHGRIGNTLGGCADGFAIEDEDDLVGRPLDAGGMPGGEAGFGVIGILVVLCGRVLVMYEGTDRAGEIACGKVDFAIARPHVTIRPEQP